MSKLQRERARLMKSLFVGLLLFASYSLAQSVPLPRSKPQLCEQMISLRLRFCRCTMRNCGHRTAQCASCRLRDSRSSRRLTGRINAGLVILYGSTEL